MFLRKKRRKNFQKKRGGNRKNIQMNELSKRLRKALSSPSFTSTRRSQFFHPSSVSVEKNDKGYKEVIGSCLREQYYRVKDEIPTNTTEPDYMISALLGDKVSELVVNLIDTHGFKMGLQRLAVEHSFYDPRINVSGRTDIIAWDFIANEPVGIEIKSVGQYKASQTIESPDDTHVMQSILYLDYYRTFMPAAQKVPKKWYIWYVSRTENWSIKGKKHGSPMTMIWDFHITLDQAGIPTVHTHASAKQRPDLCVANIHKRFEQLADYLQHDILPPRDFDLAYSEEKIATLYKLDLISRKMDKEKIERWMKKGAEPGKLNIELGDFECRTCAWKDKCWGLSMKTPEKVFSSLPEVESSGENEPPELPEMW
jgi:hypothetical protein